MRREARLITSAWGVGGFTLPMEKMAPGEMLYARACFRRAVRDWLRAVGYTGPICVAPEGVSSSYPLKPQGFCTTRCECLPCLWRILPRYRIPFWFSRPSSHRGNCSSVSSRSAFFRLFSYIICFSQFVLCGREELLLILRDIGLPSHALDIDRLSCILFFCRPRTVH